MTLPCVICHGELEPVDKDWPDINQPYRGTIFVAYGQYGSTIWDPMDGSYLEINICDLCLVSLSDAQKFVLENRTKRSAPSEHWEARFWNKGGNE